jgi:AhpD family alkylhydroperoxidase
MPRLGYVVEDSDIAERIRRRRGGRLTPLDAVLLHSPPVAEGWSGLLGAIRSQSSLPADIRELIILRVAELNGADYEWSAHEPLARAAGLADAQLAALRGNGNPAALSPSQAAALAYTDAITREVRVPDEVFAGLAGHFDEREILELTVTIGAYNLVSRVLVALELTTADRSIMEHQWA